MRLMPTGLDALCSENLQSLYMKDEQEILETRARFERGRKFPFREFWNYLGTFHKLSPTIGGR